MASDKQVTVKFTGDETGLKKSLDAVNKGLSDAEKQAQLAEAGLQKIGLAAGAIVGLEFVKAAIFPSDPSDFLFPSKKDFF